MDIWNELSLIRTKIMEYFKHIFTKKSFFFFKSFYLFLLAYNFHLSIVYI